MSTEIVSLVVEYISTYEKNLLVFKMLENKVVVSSFEFALTGGDDKEALFKEYESKIARPFKQCDLILSTFDTSVSSLRLKRSFMPNSNVANNFLVDNYGADHEKNYFLSQNKESMKDGYDFYLYFGCLSSKVRSVEELLSYLGIEKFRVNFIGEYFNKYIKNSGEINNCFVIHDEGSYVLLSAVADKKIIKNQVISKGKISQLTNIEHVLLSMSEHLRMDGYVFDKVVVLGNTKVTNALKELDLEIVKINSVIHDDLIKEPVSTQYQPLLKEVVTVESNKKKFDWDKFLGIKKGFTIAEAVVSLAIFAIVGALTATFLVIAINSNNDAKRSLLAQSYLNNVCEVFNNDPTADTIRYLTKYEDPMKDSISGIYYLDHNMDIDKASHYETSMSYKVEFTYATADIVSSAAGTYKSYVFTVLSIASLDKPKTCAGNTTFTVVK